MRKFLFFISIASAATAYAVKQVPESGKMLLPKFQQASACGERPEFLTEFRTEIVGTIDKLPQMGLLIARDVEYYVEGQSENGSALRVHGYQSFLKSDSKIICGKSAKGSEERFSLFAPTLIDTSLHRKIGNSVWQFQIVAKDDTFSAWNFKSPVTDSSGKLDKILSKVGSKYKIYQTGYNEYELMVVQENKGFTEYLSIHYDAVPTSR